MKLKCWVDNGANIHSCRKFTIEVDDEDWAEMTEKDRNDMVYEAVMEKIDWGYEEP